VQHESFETNLSNLDLTNASKKDKEELFIAQDRCISLSKKVMCTDAASDANLGSLLTMLAILMAMAIYGIENRTIIITLVGLQFIKALTSKLIAIVIRASFDIAKEDFVTLKKRKYFV
jgi:hypothetical protein